MTALDFNAVTLELRLAPAPGTTERHCADAPGMVSCRFDVLTVLRCNPGKRATKLIRRDDSGGIVVDGYDAGSWFSVESIPVEGIETFAAVLSQTALSPFAANFCPASTPAAASDSYTSRRTGGGRPSARCPGGR